MIFAVDRAGLVGSDGETHQGIFDLSYLSCIPRLQIMAPKNKWELSDMLKYAVELDMPSAIRYPRGEAYAGLKEFREPVVCGKSEWIYEEEEVALLAVGSMVQTAEAVRDILKEEGHACSLVNVRFVKPLDEDMVKKAAAGHRLLVTMEENVASGGFGERVQSFLNENALAVQPLSITIPDAYVEHGSVELLKKELLIDAESVAARIKERLSGN